MIEGFRWLFVIPTALLGYVIGFVTGLAVFFAGEWTCPTDYMVSGSCVAPWSVWVFGFASVLGASVAAALTVALPVMVAPKKHGDVAFVSLAIGTCIALYLSVPWLLFSAKEHVLWSPTNRAFMPAFLSAIGAGCFAWRWCVRRRK